MEYPGLKKNVAVFRKDGHYGALKKTNFFNIYIRYKIKLLLLRRFNGIR